MASDNLVTGVYCIQLHVKTVLWSGIGILEHSKYVDYGCSETTVICLTYMEKTWRKYYDRHGMVVKSFGLKTSCVYIVFYNLYPMQIKLYI